MKGIVVYHYIVQLDTADKKRASRADGDGAAALAVEGDGCALRFGCVELSLAVAAETVPAVSARCDDEMPEDEVAALAFAD